MIVHAVAPLVIGAFDVGSNSIKMTVARRQNHSGIQEFLWRLETIRLGAGVDKTGCLAQDRMDAAIDTLARFADEARAAGAQRLIGVATEAVRTAKNGLEFLERARAETGIALWTIDGEQEAELTFRGLAATTDLAGEIVVADVGGGSTEVIAARNAAILWARSLALGSGRLTERFVRSDPPLPEELTACRDAARDVLDTLSFDDKPTDQLLVLGGTGEYLSRLVPPGRPSTPEDVEDVLLRLSRIGSSALASSLNIAVARARVLPAGIAIVAALADRTQPRIVEGARSGLRTGLLLAAFSGEV